MKARLEAIQAQLGPDTTAFRLIDEPDVTVDWFDGVAVLSTYADFGPEEEARWADRLRAECAARAVYVKRRPKEARHLSNVRPEELAPPTPLAGDSVDSLEVLERGLRFEIRPSNGLSVGLYLDARDARAWVQAHAEARRVANFFAYTCGFGVAALKGRAARAVNVDVSRKVLDWGALNTTKNRFEANPRDFIAGDAFDWLRRLHKKGDRFDLVIVDPPGFATTKGSRFSAAQDYHQLAARAAELLAPGGQLLLLCNVAAMTWADFDGQLRRALGPSALSGERLGASAVDFASTHPLKGRVVAAP